jgi:hypothetical protein
VVVSAKCRRRGPLANFDPLTSVVSRVTQDFSRVRDSPEVCVASVSFAAFCVWQAGWRIGYDYFCTGKFAPGSANA